MGELRGAGVSTKTGLSPLCIYIRSETLCFLSFNLVLLLLTKVQIKIYGNGLSVSVMLLEIESLITVNLIA